MNDDQRHKVGAHLRRLRQQQGIPALIVAERLGISRNAVYHLERSRTDPRVSTVLRYCAAIGARVHIRLTEEQP